VWFRDTGLAWHVRPWVRFPALQNKQTNKKERKKEKKLISHHYHITHWSILLYISYLPLLLPLPPAWISYPRPSLTPTLGCCSAKPYATPSHLLESDPVCWVTSCVNVYLTLPKLIPLNMTSTCHCPVET
jgi:hypothetical protein